MKNELKEQVSILVNPYPISQEFSIYEVGYEHCRKTKPVEYKPIDYWVLHYCVSGSGFLSTQNHEFVKVTPGDLFLIPEETKNRYYPDNSDPWTYIWIGLKGSLVDTYLKKIGFGKEKTIKQMPFNQTIQSLFYDIYHTFKKEDFSNHLAFFRLFHYLSSFQDIKESTSSRETLFKEIKDYIEDSSNDDWNVTHIANTFNIDRTYLFKLFQQYLNISPSDYLKSLRLERACSLLRKTSLPITEISYELGFNSCSYFSKFFYKEMQLSPRGYRQQFITR